MTKKDINTLLCDPAHIGQAVDELDRLLVEYPYFHTGYQLYIKALQQAEDEKMASVLSRIALCVRDRSVLYEYLYYNAEEQSTAEEIISHEAVAGLESSEEPATGEEKVSQEAVASLKSFEEPATSEEKISLEEAAEGMLNAEITAEVKKSPEDVVNFKSDKEQPLSGGKQSDDQLMAIINRRLALIDIPPKEEATEKKNEIEKRVDEVVVVAEEKKKTAEEAKAVVQETVEAEKTIESEVIVNQENLARSEQSSQKELSSVDVLIDAFLESNPRIVPNDKTYDVDLTESLHEITDLGTETLADIYAMQGHKNKAIKIYEQLFLKYPEKHIYFAAQIKRLKEE